MAIKEDLVHFGICFAILTMLYSGFESIYRLGEPGHLTIGCWIDGR